MRYEEFILNEKKDLGKETPLQESGHAIAFGVRQIKKRKINSNDLLNEDMFIRSYSESVEIDVDPDKVYQFLKDNKFWVYSIVKVTNTLFDSEFTRGYSYMFSRNRNFMTRIYNEFNKLKKLEGISLHPDKWNPADIWGVKKPYNLPSFNSLTELNGWIYNEVIKKRILPISLKKVRSKNVRISLEGPEDKPEFIKYKRIRKSPNVFPTGIIVDTKKGKFGINFRSFSISKAQDITGEIIEIGGAARHGKVPKKVLSSIIRKYNIPQMTKTRIKSLSAKQLIECVLQLWQDCGHIYDKDKRYKDWNKRKNNIQNWEGYWMSIIHALEIGAFLESNKGNASDIINEMFYAAASKSKNSSHFIKIY